MFDNEHANQGLQCSSVPMCTLVVQNVALYQLGGAQDDFACSLSIFSWCTMQCWQSQCLSMCVSVCEHSHSRTS